MAAHLPVLRLFGVATVLMLTAVAQAAVDSHSIRVQESVRREFVIKGRDFTFTPSRIDAAYGDIVKITLIAEDEPFSFCVDAYRISKRAAPGRPVTFEFRADRVGAFPFYCDLTANDRCRSMRGEIVVASR